MPEKPGGSGSAQAKEEDPESDEACLKICAGNLSRSLDKDAIRAHFEQCGEVVDAFLLKNRYTWVSLGICFVTFRSRSGVEAALKLDGSEYEGQVMRVNLAKDKTDGKGAHKGSGRGSGKGSCRGSGKGSKHHHAALPAIASGICKVSVLVKNVPLEALDTDIEQFFQKGGAYPTHIRPIKNKRGNFKGKVVADFDGKAAADKAMSLNGEELRGQPLTLELRTVEGNQQRSSEVPALESNLEQKQPAAPTAPIDPPPDVDPEACSEEATGSKCKKLGAVPTAALDPLSPDGEGKLGSEEAAIRKPKKLRGAPIAPLESSDGIGTFSSKEAACAKVRVSNLRPTVDEGILRNHFKQYGEISDLHLSRNRYTWLSRGFCFITYANLSAAEAALKFSGSSFFGQEVCVETAKEDVEADSKYSYKPLKGSGKATGRGRSGAMFALADQGASLSSEADLSMSMQNNTSSVPATANNGHQEKSPEASLHSKKKRKRKRCLESKLPKNPKPDANKREVDDLPEDVGDGTALGKRIKKVKTTAEHDNVSVATREPKRKAAQKEELTFQPESEMEAFCVNVALPSGGDASDEKEPKRRNKRKPVDSEVLAESQLAAKTLDSKVSPAQVAVVPRKRLKRIADPESSIQRVVGSNHESFDQVGEESQGVATEKQSHLPKKSETHVDQKPVAHKDSGGSAAELQSNTEAAPSDTSTIHKVCAANLPLSMDEAAITKYFEKCGPIDDLKLLRNWYTWESKGVCFLTFKDQEGVQDALKLDASKVNGQAIRVNLARENKYGKGVGKTGKGLKDGKGNEAKATTHASAALGDCPSGCLGIVVRSLAFAVAEADLSQVFANCGEGPSRVRLLTDKRTGESKGKAFVDFADVSAVAEAAKLHGTLLQGRKLIIEYARPK